MNKKLPGIRRKLTSNGAYAAISIAPPVLIILLVILYPLLYAILLSFRDFRLNKFVGLNNYISLLTEPDFLMSAVRTFNFTVIAVGLVVTLSFAIALLINQKMPGHNLLKFVLLLPYALPGSISAVTWKWIYDSTYGILNGILCGLGILDNYISFTGDPNLAMPAIIFAYVWKFIPYSVFLLLAGLIAIPKTIYEAAQIDGTTAWRTFTRITVPLLKPVFKLVLVVQTVFALLMHFGLVYVLTGGGPGSITTTMPWYVYNETFSYMRFGRGSAGAVMLTVMMLGFIYLYLVVLKSKNEK